MKVTHKTYVPALKWRQGEYQALLRLSDVAKASIVPFVMIPPIEFDFEDHKPKKTVQKHVEPFARRFLAKWQDRPAWVDVDPSLQDKTMASGLDVTAHVFAELRKAKAQAVPVVSLNHHPTAIAAAKQIVQQDHQGVALRVRLEDLMLSDFAKKAAALIKGLNVSENEVDFVVDLENPAYEPYNVFADALLEALGRVTGLDAYRSFVVIGTAFPDSMKDVGIPGGSVGRHDWQFYKELMGRRPKVMRRPSFGDYTIVHPGFVAIDMRMIKPAGKLVYARENEWTIRKGKAFRDHPEQMHKHCSDVVGSGYFCGPNYSDGDKFIAQCATKKVGASTLTKWKEVGISHHIMRVLEDLSNFDG